jgi:hypothetical protein
MIRGRVNKPSQERAAAFYHGTSTTVAA